MKYKLSKNTRSNDQADTLKQTWCRYYSTRKEADEACNRLNKPLDVLGSIHFIVTEEA